MKNITEEQIREFAKSIATKKYPYHNYSLKETFETAVNLSIETAKWVKDQNQPEWITINLEETETLPDDFEPVLCWTTDNNLQVLMMLKYSGGVDCYEWETQGLKPNKAFPIDYVVKWIFIDDPTS